MLAQQVVAKVQSVRAQRAANDASIAALHANVAGQQGVFAALMAVLDYAAGGGLVNGTTGLPVVTVEHVESARRLINISTDIRVLWRQEFSDSRGDGGSEGEEATVDAAGAHRAVEGNYRDRGFAEPLPTQPAQAAPATSPRHTQGDDVDAQAEEIWRGTPHEGVAVLGEEEAALDDAPGEAPTPLLFGDVADDEEFDRGGLGYQGAMLSPTHTGKQVFKDRELLRRLLLTGKSQFTVSQIVDNYAMASGSDRGDAKKRRIRPGRSDVVAVLKAAFRQFPRLGLYQDDGRAQRVVLKSWSLSERNQILYHNALMRCCRVSLHELSQRRARFHDARPRGRPVGQGLSDVRRDADPAGGEHAAPADGSAAARGAVGGVPAASTPPGGLEA